MSKITALGPMPSGKLEVPRMSLKSLLRRDKFGFNGIFGGATMMRFRLIIVAGDGGCLRLPSLYRGLDCSFLV